MIKDFWETFVDFYWRHMMIKDLLEYIKGIFMRQFRRWMNKQSKKKQNTAFSNCRNIDNGLGNDICRVYAVPDLMPFPSELEKMRKEKEKNRLAALKIKRSDRGKR